MAVSVRGVASVRGSTFTSATVPLPNGDGTNTDSLKQSGAAAQAGDLLMLRISGNKTEPGITWQDPAGWTLLRKGGLVSGGINSWLGYRIMQAGDTAPLLAVSPQNSENVGYAAHMVALTASSTVELAQAILSAAASGFAYDFPRVTPTRSPSLVLTFSANLPGYAAGMPVPTGNVKAAEIRDPNTFQHTVLTEALSSLAQSAAYTFDNVGQGSQLADFDRLVLWHNTPPNAPLVSLPGTIDQSQPTVVTVGFSDPDSPDSPSAARIRHRQGGAWTEIYVASPVGSVTIPGGTLSVGSVEVQGQSTDARGAVGSWSASVFGTVSTPPAGPVFTDPLNGATISTSARTFTVSVTDLDELEWKILANDGVTVLNAGATLTGAAAQARQFTATGLPNSTTVKPWVRVKLDGLWSDPTINANPVSFTPPAAPSAVVLANSSEASISVSISNPTPSGGQPAVLYNDVLRRETLVGGDGIRVATNKPVNSVFIDHAPASGLDYEYLVRAVAGGGTSASSAWVGGVSTAASVVEFPGF